jgi:predicted dehydrogenase
VVRLVEGERLVLRWGVLGASGFAERMWIPSAQQCRFGSVTAIASRDLDRAKRAADRLGIATAHGSYEALLADPAVDAVYIPLPNHLHATWSIAAAEAGKHVLCEKPLAMNAAEAVAMGAAAERAGVILMEGFMYRFHPGWTTLHEIVQSGRIGEPQAMHSWFSYFNDDEQNIRNIAAAGGGALYDIGCYPISAARWLFGREPIQVSGVMHRDARLGVDTLTEGLLEFDGAVASIGCSTRSEPDQWLRVQGSEGIASISIPFNVPLDRAIEIRIVHGGDPPVAPAAEVIVSEAANQYTLMTDAFARAVLDQRAAPTPLTDAIANLRVMDALVAAGESHAPVSIES